MARRSTDSFVFDSLRLEGGFFVPAILEKIALGEHTAQKAPDYKLPKGLALIDEQGRAFRIAGALWKNFDASRSRRDIDPAAATRGFATELFRDALDYTDITPCTEPVALADRAYPITAFAAAGRIPIIIAPHTLGLDDPDERFAIVGSGSRRRSAYQLAQQFLNANPACTWALITNGLRLRLVRDADTLTRPAYLEADLELVLRTGAERYPDFAAIWRIFHASRAADTDAACIWENWRREGQEQGERVRDGLRNGVTDAILAFGNGFLAHPANDTLRASLQSGALSVDAYFQQLLRLVYRCLFLFTIEDRKLLHDTRNDTDSEEKRRARETYAQGYALRRLRDRSLRHSGFDRHHDLWAGVQVVFRSLANGEPRLDLPALGGLFAAAQCPALDAARLENRALLAAMRSLRWSNRNGQYAPIDYGNMGPEELGSVYESLLELVPTLNLPARQFGFVGLTEEGRTDGNARKTTGSYYTPDSLVQELLDSALDPVIAQKLAARPADPAAALLEITVADISCGSGHFLLAAARRLAERLAELRATDGAVVPEDYRRALHDVIARCIYGVDRNPMALELARTALWLEGFEPGRPLSFLDHHLVCGDSLLGLTDLKILSKGIPADAFTALSGDSKAAAKTLAAENRAALKELGVRARNRDVFETQNTTDLLAELRRIEAMPENTPADVEARAAAYEHFLNAVRTGPLAQAADLYIAAFLTPKVDGASSSILCPTTRTLADLLYPIQGSIVPAELLDAATARCREARVLHWPLAFIGIFKRGGFDCVLGNPPWEVSQLGEEEYFAARAPEIAALKGAKRKSAIAKLEQTNPLLWNEYMQAKRLYAATNTFSRESERFELTAIGKLNTFSLFAESISRLTHKSGYSGFIIPSGIVTDDSTKHFFSSLVTGKRLILVIGFDNQKKIFPSVHPDTPFVLMTLGPGRDSVPMCHYITEYSHLNDSRRWCSLSRADFKLVNPNTCTSPIYRSQADATLTGKIYRQVPVLIEESNDTEPEKNPWGISFSQGLFNMTSASHLFLNAPSPEAMPLYEAKMIHQFDHRWATYYWDTEADKYDTKDILDIQKNDADFTPKPRYWVEERHVLASIGRVPKCISSAVETPDAGGWEAVDESAVRNAFATWIEASRASDELAGFSNQTTRDHIIEVGGRLFAALPTNTDDWLDKKAIAEAKTHAPLTDAELALLRESPTLIDAAQKILDHRSPRWLMGWRDITNATNERTVIASVIPRVAVGHKMPLIHFPNNISPKLSAALLGNLCSLTLDYVARQKVGGTSLTYHYFKQFPVLPPTAYAKADLDYIVPRVLELTYTAHDMKPWAEDLGYKGAPFAFNPTRRAQLRAELDARYAKLYGLTRGELEYILDATPPSVSFPVLKNNELKQFGTYRTQDLVRAAWEKLSGNAVANENEIVLPAMPSTLRTQLRDDQSHWLLFVYHFLLRAGDKATLPLIEDAWITLIQRKQNSLAISNVIGEEQFHLWDASFNQEYPNRGFIEFLISLNDSLFINVERGSWKINIPKGSVLLRTPPDPWRDYDAAVALLIANQRIEAMQPLSETPPVTTTSRQNEFIEAFALAL